MTSNGNSLRTPLLVAYPAVFKQEEPAGYFIDFPDIQGCYTGINQNDVAHGLVMAEEVLGMTLADYIENGEELPTPTSLNEVAHEADEFVTLVRCDIGQYFKDMKPVKKTLTIPTWANDWGVRAGLNFSQLLTDAIAQSAHHIEETA